MIGWITDNPLSRTVMESIPGIEIRHIRDFNAAKVGRGVFYGILRGAGRAMQALDYWNTCAMHPVNYYYIDNGYFDALYVDKNKQKSMAGKFRVVKNGMHEVYPNAGKLAEASKVLVLPPSPYSANFYDTTPEDWTQAQRSKYYDSYVRVREKNSATPLEDDLNWCDGVVSFNSMAVMRATELGKAVCDTHGIFRREMAVYDINGLSAFYEPKQFTLQEFKEGKWDISKGV